MSKKDHDSSFHTIALIGMMGSGKTTVGQYLAKKIAMVFYDTDTQLEKKLGKTVTQCFSHDGEKFFRTQEACIIKELLQKPEHKVLALGGGAILAPDTRCLLAKNAFTVWLKPNLNTLHQRTQKETQRPLLQGKDRKKTLTEIYQARKDLYALADTTVASTQQCTVSQVSQRIITALPAAMLASSPDFNHIS